MDTSAAEQQGRAEAVALTIVAPPTPGVPRDVHQHLLPPSPASASSPGASCATEFRASASPPAPASGMIYPATSPAWEATDEAGPGRHPAAAAAAVDDPATAVAAAISSSLAAPICSTSSSSPARQDRSPVLAAAAEQSTTSSSNQSAAANLRLDPIPIAPAPEPPSAAATAAGPSPSTAPGIEAAAAAAVTTTSTTTATTHISETRAKNRRSFFGPSHHDDSTHEDPSHSELSSYSPMTQQADQDLPSSRSALSGIFELEMESPTVMMSPAAAAAAAAGGGGGGGGISSLSSGHHGSGSVAVPGTKISEMIQGGPHEDSGHSTTAAAAMAAGRKASTAAAAAAAAPPPPGSSSCVRPSSLGPSMLTRGVWTSNAAAAPSPDGGAPGQPLQGPWGRLQEVIDEIKVLNPQQRALQAATSTSSVASTQQPLPPAGGATNQSSSTPPSGEEPAPGAINQSLSAPSIEEPKGFPTASSRRSDLTAAVASHPIGTISQSSSTPPPPVIPPGVISQSSTTASIEERKGFATAPSRRSDFSTSVAPDPRMVGGGYELQPGSPPKYSSPFLAAPMTPPPTPSASNENTPIDASNFRQGLRLPYPGFSFDESFGGTGSSDTPATTAPQPLPEFWGVSKSSDSLISASAVAVGGARVGVAKEAKAKSRRVLVEGETTVFFSGKLEGATGTGDGDDEEEEEEEEEGEKVGVLANARERGWNSGERGYVGERLIRAAEALSESPQLRRAAGAAATIVSTAAGTARVGLTATSRTLGKMLVASAKSFEEFVGEQLREDGSGRVLRKEGATGLLVPRGSTLTQTFVVAAGCYLCWEFRVEDYDLGFALRCRSQGMGGSTEEDIFELKRYAAGETFQGRWAAEGDAAAVLVMVWDNSYSRLRPKTLAYKVHVVHPGIDPEAPPPPSPSTPADKPPFRNFNDGDDDNEGGAGGGGGGGGGGQGGGGGRDSLVGDTEAFAIDESEGEEASYPATTVDVRGGGGEGGEGQGKKGHVLDKEALSSASHPAVNASAAGGGGGGGGGGSATSRSPVKLAERGRQEEKHASNQALSCISENTVDGRGGGRQAKKRVFKEALPSTSFDVAGGGGSQGKEQVFDEALSSAGVDSGEGSRGEEPGHRSATGEGEEKGPGGEVVGQGGREAQKVVGEGSGKGVQEGSAETMVEMVKMEDFLAANSARSDDSPRDSGRVTCDV